MTLLGAEKFGPVVVSRLLPAPKSNMFVILYLVI